MVVTVFPGNKITGLSGDAKPTDVLRGSTFVEQDTGSQFAWNGSAWVKVQPGLISGIAAGLSSPYSTTANGCFGPGLAVTLKATSTNILILAQIGIGLGYTPGSTGGVIIYLYRTTGSIPAQGAGAVGGDTVITQANIVTYENSTGLASAFTDVVPFIFTDTTAVAGTTYSYYFYIAFAVTPAACVIQGSSSCGITALTGF